MTASTSESVARPAGGVRPDQPLRPLPPQWRSLARAFVHQARSRPKTLAMVDSTGARLTYSDALLRATALARVLKRETGPSPYVGVLIPPTAPGAIANLALCLAGKIPVNLNYTASQAIIDNSIDQCGITHVVTSKRALDKFKLAPKGTMIFLEDIPKRVTGLDKAAAAFVARVAPIAAMPAVLPGLRGDHLDQTATVIFTSGSTGDPKGVVLSNRNILSNVCAIDQAVQLREEEVVVGILPFFHSFGFTVAIWTVLCLGKTAVYHFSPLDARIIGNLCQEHRATVLFASPTFVRNYIKKCDREQFESLRLLVLGAEKLKPSLAKEIQEFLKIEPLEGYGCTELSPVVAVNVPQDVQAPDGRVIRGNKLGTVGRPLPGTAIRTTDADTGADLPRGSEGMVHVSGPQVMVGYLNRPDATAKVVKNGWYCTGDIGFVDADGFLTITGRLSRFSKIAGEMVPHESVESAIAELLGGEQIKAAVTSLPDPKRGERLIVVHTEMGVSPDELCRRLTETDLPRLWLPNANDFIAVAELPLLATGKLDLRKLKTIAEELSAK